MDAFAGYKRAAAMPHAAEVLDPFHIVALTGEKVTKVRCRLRHEVTGHRGTKANPLYRCRRALLKTAVLRTDRQQARMDVLLADQADLPLKLAEGTYQKIIRCYREPDRSKGRAMMAELVK
jgi:transposase